MRKYFMILISGILISALFSCSEEAVSKEDYEKASEEYGRVLQLNPYNEEARQRLEIIKSRLMSK